MSKTLSSTGALPTRVSWTPAVVLAIACFLTVTSEMLPSGLLPEISRGLGVSESDAGVLVGVFALTVALTSAPLTILFRRIPRHALIVAVLALIGVSALLTAFSFFFAATVLARVLGGLAHGVFWSTINSYQARLVPKAQLAKFISITQTGGTLAFVLGVPFGTYLGHTFGWRSAFAIIAGLTLIGAVVVWRMLPRVRTEPDEVTSSITLPGGGRYDPTVLPIVVLCITTAVLTIGHYSFYTYIAPYLTRVLGVSTGDVPALLLLGGASGGVALLFVAGGVGRRPARGVVGAAVLLVLALIAMATLAPLGIPGIVAFAVVGFSFGAIPPLLVTTLMATASARIRDVANAFYTTAFNIGIGLGALLGGRLLELVGLATLPLLEAGAVALAVVLFGVGTVIARRRTASLHRSARAAR
jgi:MFS transporter, DHA1 family, inner membrane transport protein